MIAAKRILEKEIEFALGCTEPGAVALATAKARETLGGMPDILEVHVSGNILKNAMNVGIPGTGLKGIEIAAALGCIAGKSEYGLEVLRDVKQEDILRAQEMIREGRVKIILSRDCDRLYINARCIRQGETSGVVIEKFHTNIVSVSRNGGELPVEMTPAEETKTVVEESCDGNAVTKGEDYGLSLRGIWDYIQQEDPSGLAILRQVVEVNGKISGEGLSGEYGMGVGRHLYDRMEKNGTPDFSTYVTARTAAAADARMAGCLLPVMATTGSGNQGITASVPVIAAAEWMKCEEEKLYRALALSELVTIHVKEYIGRLSALCGCAIAASIGSACGITFLLGGEYENVECAVQNMVADISGLICDGAKAGCALKIATSVGGAVQCAFLAAEAVRVPDRDGIVCGDVEDTIRNLGNLGNEGMETTDGVILGMMMANR